MSASVRVLALAAVTWAVGSFAVASHAADGGGQAEGLSWINVPIAVDLEVIRGIVEEKVPKRYEWNERGDWAGDLARDEETYGHIERGPFELTVAEDGAVVMQLRWTARPTWRGWVLVAHPAVVSDDCSGTITARATIAFNQQTWNPTVSSFDLKMVVERAFISGPFGIGRFSVKGAIQGVADNLAAQHRQPIHDALKKAMPDITAKVAKLHDELQGGIQIGHNPVSFLRVQAVAAWLLPPRQQENQIVSHVGIRSLFEGVISQNRPEHWKADVSLPPLQDAKPENVGQGFEFVLPIALDWCVIQDELKKLSRDKPLKIKLPDGQISIAQVLDIGPAGDEGGIQATVRGVRWSAEGQDLEFASEPVTVRFDLAYDPEKKQLHLQPFGGAEDDLQSRLIARAIAMRLAGSLNVQLKKELANAAESLNRVGTELEERLKDQIGLRVKVTNVGLERLRLEKEAAHLQGTIRGTAELNLP